MKREMLARGGLPGRRMWEASRATQAGARGKRLHTVGGGRWPLRRTGAGAQKKVAVSGFRDIDGIVNSEDWYRMSPSTTYFLSLREHRSVTIPQGCGRRNPIAVRRRALSTRVDGSTVIGGATVCQMSQSSVIRRRHECPKVARWRGRRLYFRAR